jgi:hypothetical protein
LVVIVHFVASEYLLFQSGSAIRSSIRTPLFSAFNVLWSISCLCRNIEEKPNGPITALGYSSANYIQRNTSDVSDLGKYIIIKQLNRAATSPSVTQPSYITCCAKGEGKGSKSIGEINQLNPPPKKKKMQIWNELYALSHDFNWGR